jgi:hypothetical protein
MFFCRVHTEKFGFNGKLSLCCYFSKPISLALSQLGFYNETTCDAKVLTVLVV